MQHIKQRSLAELGLITIVVATILTVAVWQVWSLSTGTSDSENEASDAGAASAIVTTIQATTSTTASTATEISFACEATPPAELPPAQVGGYLFQFPEWYGGSTFWLSPAFSGAHVGVSLEQPGIWYSGDTLVRSFGTAESTKITGTLQDGEAVFEVVSQETLAPFAGSTAPAFTETIVRIPEPGCWDLTAVSGDQTIELTVPVLPYEDRPDVRAMSAARERLLPYPPPATCTVTDWVGPQDRGIIDLNAAYWLGDGGISGASATGILWDDETNRIFWLTSGTPDTSTFILNGTNLDRSGSNVRSSTNITNDLLDSSVVFPGDGCWELTVETPTESSTYTVYVYPATCRPDPETSEIPEDCLPPGS